MSFFGLVAGKVRGQCLNISCGVISSVMYIRSMSDCVVVSETMTYSVIMDELRTPQELENSEDTDLLPKKTSQFFLSTK